MIGYGLECVERVQRQTNPHEENITYLNAKRDKMGHMLNAKGDAE